MQTLTLNYDTKHIEGEYYPTRANTGNFKFFHCRFNPDAKKWRLPMDSIKLQQLEEYVERWNSDEDLRNEAIEKVKQEEAVKKEAKSQVVNDLWQQALDTLRFRYVKRGTKEYDLVYAEFDKLLKANK